MFKKAPVQCYWYQDQYPSPADAGALDVCAVVLSAVPAQSGAPY